MNEQLITWLRTGERGISSNTIVEVLEHMPIGAMSGRWLARHPSDPSDLRRCILLVEAVPEYRAHLTELNIISPVWAVLVAHWDELTELLRDELGQDLGYGRADRTYARMRELITGAGGT